MNLRAVNLGVQPLLENAFADCFLAGSCAVPARVDSIYRELRIFWSGHLN